MLWHRLHPVSYTHLDVYKRQAPFVCEAILPDDVIMVKGSNGSHMNVIVAALGSLKH